MQLLNRFPDAMLDIRIKGAADLLAQVKQRDD